VTCITCCNTVTNAIVLLEERLFVEAQNEIMFDSNLSESSSQFLYRRPYLRQTFQDVILMPQCSHVLQQVLLCWDAECYGERQKVAKVRENSTRRILEISTIVDSHLLMH
jgi:hypothetical protein